MRRTLLACLLAAAACGDDGGTPPEDLPPTQNSTRDVGHTALAIDLAAHGGTATITFGASEAPGASLEVGDLDVRGVTRDGAPVQFAVVDHRLDLGVSGDEATVAIDYGWQFHEDGDGVDMDGFTL